jgi:hypothetical protein
VISAFRTLRAALAFGALLFASSAALRAQVTATTPVTNLPQYNERWDVYGGAAYAHFNPGEGHGSQIHANNLLGWNGDAMLWFRPLWGLETSARGFYGNMSLPQNNIGVPTNAHMSEHLFLFGPNFRLYRTEKYAAGFHALIGAAYGSFDSSFPQGVQPQVLGVYNNKLAFGAAVGAWGDYNLTPKWAVRFTADWQPTHYGFSTQNEFAGSVGVVYKLGSLRGK